MKRGLLLLLATTAGTLLATSGMACGEDRVPCLYERDSAAGSGGLEEHPGCARVEGDRLVEVGPEHLAAVLYVDGLASMWVAGHWFYVRRDGMAAPALTYDNGPDSFSDGLFRSPQEGKIVFVNRQLKEAFESRYDWAWPFEGGLALVCQGCSPVATEDEHTEIRGGRWGVINLAGHEIVPIELPSEEARTRLREARPDLATQNGEEP